MYVNPLFLLLGLPQPLVDRILETNPIFEKILGFFVHPIIAGLLFTLVFSFWHFGVFTRQRSRTRLCTWPNTYPCSLLRLRCGGQFADRPNDCPPFDMVLKCFTLLLLCSARHPSLPPLLFQKRSCTKPIFTQRIMNLSPLEDQRTGGVLMKLANMAVSVGVLASIFHRWSSRQKRKRKGYRRDTKARAKSISLGRNSTTQETILRVLTFASSISADQPTSTHPIVHRKVQSGPIKSSLRGTQPKQSSCDRPLPLERSTIHLRTLIFSPKPGQRNFPSASLRNQFT